MKHLDIFGLFVTPEGIAVDLGSSACGRETDRESTSGRAKWTQGCPEAPEVIQVRCKT